MINILSYLGMNIQSEVCLWALLGLVRTIFDATLFKVNANLKQVLNCSMKDAIFKVWQMTMPLELTMPVQRVLRTMISGVMLVQCFSVYVYLASYIVLLYPVFLEERPTLVLPWLLLAAIRKLLCELTSLALGLGTCVLVGPAKPPCIKFVIVKVASITPAFYMWMLIFSYYHVLKVASAFKTFPNVLPSSDHDYGLELAVRRRRTKSLQGEEQLRKKLVANYYGDRTQANGEITIPRAKLEISSRMVHSTDMSLEDFNLEIDILPPISINMTETYEDWSGSEIIIPRDTDRILEQFVLMLLRIGAYMKTEGMDSINSEILNTSAAGMWTKYENLNGPVIPTEETETPPLVGSKGNTASYLLEYPQIFNRKIGSDTTSSDRRASLLKTVHSQNDSLNSTVTKVKKRAFSVSSDETFSSSDKHPPQKSLQIESEILDEKLKRVPVAKKEKVINEDIKTTQESVHTDDSEQPQSEDSMSSTVSRGSGRKKTSNEGSNEETSGASTSHTRTSKVNRSSTTSKTNSSSKSKSDKSRKDK